MSLERSRGNLSGAIEALRKYLDVMANDKEGWEELAELYLEVGHGWWRVSWRARACVSTQTST